jgi:hypothetical protein
MFLWTGQLRSTHSILRSEFSPVGKAWSSLVRTCLRVQQTCLHQLSVINLSLPEVVHFWPIQDLLTIAFSRTSSSLTQRLIIRHVEIDRFGWHTCVEASVDSVFNKDESIRVFMSDILKGGREQ